MALRPLPPVCLPDLVAFDIVIDYPVPLLRGRTLASKLGDGGISGAVLANSALVRLSVNSIISFQDVAAATNEHLVLSLQ